MTRWVEFDAGTLLVLVVFADVFSTVLVPRASYHGVRFGHLLAQLLSPGWRRVAAALPSARLRQSVRGGFGPIILVLSLAAWVAALAAGFALMLHAQPRNVAFVHASFGEAVFQATLALSTLGVVHTDITGAARWVVAIAGVSGFSVVSLVVAFLLSIQSALHRRETLVLTLAARAGRPPSARQILRAMAGADDTVLAGFFASWEAWTAEVMQSHLSYPVLCRFRSLDENMEWLACAGAVLDAAALIAASDPPDYRRAVLAADFLVRTASRASHELGRLLGARGAAGAEDPAHLALFADELPQLGYGALAGAPARAATFAALRAGYAPTLAALADQLDIRWCDTVLGPEAAEPARR